MTADHRRAAHDKLASIAKGLSGRARGLIEAAEGAERFLRDWPIDVAIRPWSPRRLPVLDHLGAAPSLASPATADLVAALVENADALAWGQTYTAADFGQSFLERYGWTELIGLRGPIPSTGIACGVLMLGPDVDYPAHAHEAEEIYLPLSGTASWLRGDEGFVARRPGSAIHHPPWVPHAMRTGPEPLLALYVWRGGDLAAKSRIVGRPDPVRRIEPP